MFKRKIDIILSEGHGRQLLWLLAITIVCIAIAVFVATVIFHDTLEWQYVIGLFLDPGVYGSFPDKGHDVFRITIALLSVFLFSALLVSVFTNVFENISESVRLGRRRYKLKGHIVVFGGGRHLEGIVSAFKNSGKTVVVMSETKPAISQDYIFYRGCRTRKEDIVSANVKDADTIYIIGEDDEVGHDAKNLQTLDILNEICVEAECDIHCFITVSDIETTEVFQYLKLKQSSKLLLVDVLNDFEYEAEQLLIDTNTLPVIKTDDERNLEVLIIGKGNIAKAVAYTCAHICHYPNYVTKGKKTRITFIAENMKHWMDDFLSSRPALFELSEYCFVSENGTIDTHHAESKYGDFLDVEWRFVDTYESSSLARSIISELSDNSKHYLNIFVCHQESSNAISSVLHLPSVVYGRADEAGGAYNIAVYLKDNPSVINRANETEMFNHITIFGGNNFAFTDPLLNRRSKYGQRVNYVYDKAYGNPKSQDEEQAWYKIPEAHKYSSIYCANAMFLRRECFDMDGDRLPIYEAEHRRWMMSELLMGYKAGERTNRKYYIHADIIPFDALSKAEQEKDKILIDEMDYILQ